MLLQALHPVAMAAVSLHSDYRTDPWGRFRRTSEYLSTTIFGTTDEAEGAAARVRAVHRKVTGVDHVTGRSYRADDPDLLLWVHAVEVQSFLVGYRRYAARLDDHDADTYVGEMVRSAELVGLHREDVPQTVEELDAFVSSVALVATPAAKEGLRYVLSPPMPLALKPLWGIPATAAIAILPPEARKAYGLPWIRLMDPGVQVPTKLLLRAVQTVLPPPPPVRRAREIMKRVG